MGAAGDGEVADHDVVETGFRGGLGGEVGLAALLGQRRAVQHPAVVALDQAGEPPEQLQVEIQLLVADPHGRAREQPPHRAGQAEDRAQAPSHQQHPHVDHLTGARRELPPGPSAGVPTAAIVMPLTSLRSRVVTAAPPLIGAKRRRDHGGRPLTHTHMGID